MPTLRDIAVRANVSASTVSRVLNDYPYVDAATRVTVLEAAEQIGYTAARRPNLSTRTVLLLVRDGGNEDEQGSDLIARDFERTVSVGVQSVFAAQGITTRLQRTRLAVDEQRAYTEDPTIAGLILLGGVVNRQFVQSLQQTALPFVVAGGHVLPLRANCVMADIARGTEDAVVHLVASGRRRIGLVNGPQTATTSDERFRGYRYALTQFDLSFQPNQVVAADFRAESGYEQTRQLIQQCPDLDAILYADDLVAMGGMRALREHGRSVPGDVAIIGFYDYDLARFTDPPLTSMHLDMERIGSMAARRLSMLIEAPDDQDWFMLVETTLIVRESA